MGRAPGWGSWLGRPAHSRRQAAHAGSGTAGRRLVCGGLGTAGQGVTQAGRQAHHLTLKTPDPPHGPWYGKQHYAPYSRPKPMSAARFHNLTKQAMQTYQATPQVNRAKPAGQEPYSAAFSANLIEQACHNRHSQ